jgi:hypothetical protein
MSRRPDELTHQNRTVDVTDETVAMRRDPIVVEGNGTAIAAFVLGLLALVLTFTVALAPVAVIFGLLGLFMGIKGRGNAKRHGGLHKGLATSGLLTGLLALLLVAAATFAGLQLLNNNPQLREDVGNVIEDAQP